MTMANKYNYIAFIEKIPSLEQEAIYAEVLEYAIKLPKTYDKSKIKQYFKDCLEDGSLSTIKDRLGICTSCIDKQADLLEDQRDLTDKLLVFKNNIIDFFDIIQEVVNEKLISQKAAEEKETDATGTATSYQSFDEKTKEIQNRLDAIENKLQTQERKLEKHEGTLNDKLFTLIINTVAILGIFVAVAFAGFGANTLFSNIVFTTDADIYTNTFYLSLTAFFAYNLLFLLFYCIFKIIERISPASKIGLWKHCWAFILIDFIMLAITVFLFFRVR